MDDDSQIAMTRLERVVAIEATKEAGRRAVRSGLLWAGSGLLLTVLTYGAAGPGETYYVFWGAVLYGGWRLIRGIGLLSEVARLEETD